jgi:uncharacterized protein YecE (DUF72 family)
MAKQVRIGTSGWRYREWRGDFYPKGLQQRLELQYVSQRVNSVEINGSFYSLQRPELYRRWYGETPDDFVFAVKGSRFITHMKKLNDVRTPLANFMASGVLALGEKLGPFLWQFPERMPMDDRFEKFFKLLPRDTDQASWLARKHDARVTGRSQLKSAVHGPLRHAVEIRDACAKWFHELLEEQGIATVVADTAGRFPTCEAVTADHVYVRLHGETILYGGTYSKRAVAHWSEKISKWRKRGEVFVYFDNDAHGYAPWDAIALAEAVDGKRERRKAA